MAKRLANRSVIAPGDFNSDWPLDGSSGQVQRQALIRMRRNKVWPPNLRAALKLAPAPTPTLAELA